MLMKVLGAMICRLPFPFLPFEDGNFSATGTQHTNGRAVVQYNH